MKKTRKQLTQAQLEQRRNAGRGNKGKKRDELSPAELQQRRDASQLSTGPKTDEGKVAVSRNAWKHGQYAAINNAWRDIGLGIVARPCKSSCAKFPCSLVEDGQTKPGQDCLDKSAFLEAFNTLMDVLTTEDVKYAHGMLAVQTAQALDILRQLVDYINQHDVVVEQPIVNKMGSVVGHKLVTNPALHYYNKMFRDLGLSLPELLATPKSVKQIKTEEDTAEAVHELLGRVARVSSNGPVKRKTIDVTPESIRHDDVD